MDSHHQPPDPKSGALLVELQGSKWSETPVLHRVRAGLQSAASTTSACLAGNGETSGICTRHDGFHRAGCCSYIMVSIEKWIRLPVLPRSSLVYKTSACAALPSRNEMAALDGIAPSTSRVRVGRSAFELQG
jgi:hypothetical protein